MTPGDWDKFYAFFKHAGFAFAMKDDDMEKKAEAYFYFLGKYDLEVVLEAFRGCMEKMKYFPTISEIIREISFRGMSDDDLALAAWEKAWKALREIGGNKTVVFDDPFIHQAIGMMGGWTEFSLAKTKDEPRLRKDFVSWYKHFLRKKDFSEVPAMMGWLEAEAVKGNGRYSLPPAVVGNKEEAKRVYEMVYGKEALKKLLKEGEGREDRKAIAQ